MDDIPLPGLAPDPTPSEPSAEFPQLPVEGPALPSEPNPPAEPPTLPALPVLPENPPAPSGDPPPPTEVPPTPLEEAPVPADSLVSFFQASNAPTADAANCDGPVQGPQLDPNSVSPFASAADSTDPALLAAAAGGDGASGVFGENYPLASIVPNASAPVGGAVHPQLPSVGEAQPAQPPAGDQQLAAEMAGAEAAAVLAAAPTTVEAYPVQYADAAADPQQVITDPALQSGQVAYSASYMGYPQMSDPSMMHNYSYMANSYTDYVSMYHAGRMSRYPNTYASYQGYNYSYPHMQQMYDGRNMAAYATGSYSQQMLPASSTSMMGNFTPPLPTDYKAPSFSTEPPQAKKPAAKANVDALADSDLPPLPEGAMPEQPKDQVEAPPKAEDAEPPAEAAEAATEAPNDDGSDRMVTDQDEPADNFNEDVNRYSPSLPMDEDEANHQSSGVDDNSGGRSASKSSVLGKAQAKKRLMAFSISKQAAAAQIAAKKQAQTTGRDKKENGEPSGKAGSDETLGPSNENVFDDKHSKKRPKKSSKMEKARETIEEIEEIKRNEMTTMMYRQNLLNDSTNDHSSDRRRDRNRRRSRSYSRSRSRRRSRSRSHDRKSRRGDKKYRRRSRTRSRSKSASPSRSPSQADKKASVKTSDIKSWDDFVEAGFQLDRYRRVKFNENKHPLVSEIEIRKKEGSKHGRYRGERRSTSIEREVIEEYRKRKINMFEAPTELKKPFVYHYDKSNADEGKEYPSHIMHYTASKPTLKFCENPKTASLHFINRAQLLESVPDDVALLVKRFWSTIRPKRMKEKLVHQREDGERSPSVDESGSKCPIRWWSSDPLHEDGDKHIAEDEIEDDDEEIIPFMPYSEIPVESTTSVEKSASKLLEKPISAGVRKSRFEDATEEKPGVSVVVRSRWDSDYEDSPKNNDANLSIGAENTYRESPKVDSQLSRLNSEGPVLPPMEDSYQTKSVAAVPPEETSTSTFVNKKHVLIERRPKKNKDKSKRGSKDIRESSEPKKTRKSKSSLSPDEWREETDYEPIDVPPPKETKKVVEEEYVEETFENDKSGEHKLVSEYEEFMKSVSLEQPKNENLPLYEGPKPPPLQEGPKPPAKLEKLNDTEETMSKSSIRDANPSPSSDNRMEVDDEEVFDIDKFFLKEKKMRRLAENEQNKKKDDFVNEPIKKKDNYVNDIIKKTDDVVESDEEVESEVETKHKKKRDKKEKPKKKKIAVKVKKLSAKNKKKQKEKKKKYDSSSNSSDSSDNSDSDDSDSSDDSASSDSSSTSSSNSSSSERSSSDSTSHKKRKRSKKVKKKDKKPERKSSDKGKKKKKKQKQKEVEVDSKKKKKKSSKSDDKKKKSKKLHSENILELLAVSLKKNEPEENDVSKKMVKEKRKKRKKKSERDKDDKVPNSLLNVIPGEVGREFSEEKILAKMKELEKGSPDSKKKKKKGKKKRSPSFSEDEAPSWKKKKLIDPREIEESVAKAQMNPFFDDNLDDWDRLAAPSAAEHSMRDNSKNELENKDAKKKKKLSSTKQRLSKRVSDKPVEKQREEKQKNKTAHKKKKKPASKKLKKKDDKKTFLDKENKKPLSSDDRDSWPPSIEPNFNKESPQSAKDLGSDLDRSPQSTDGTPAYRVAECETSQLDNTAQSSDAHLPSPSADRYSPTFCDEDNNLSPTKQQILECAPLSAAASYYNFQNSALYSCFAPTNLQNISLPTAVPKPVPAPLPVPPPSIQPSHSFASSAVKESSLASARESVVSSSTASAAEPSVVNYPTTGTTNPELSPSVRTTSTSDTDGEPKAFSNVVITEPDKASYKSFSVGKLEVKTKAAKKFVHSNIFDSFEGKEQLSKPEPLTPTTTVPESVESVKEPAAPVEPPNIPEEDVEKEEFQARPCIALPELPASQCDTTPAAASAADRSPRRESTPIKREAAGEAVRHHSSSEKRSRSRDHSSRRRADRDSSHRDRRRSRTRTRSRSRSYDRYRKRQFRGRDPYKRGRGRDRSRSRSRRRSRDRDFKENRYRRDKRRSYSREPKKSRRERTPEAELPRMAAYDEQPPLPPTMAPEERARVDANYDAEYERRYSELRAREARESVAELSRRLHESQYHNADLKPADINAFQATLYRLRDTLAGVNCKERHVDSIDAIITKLEGRKMEAAAPALAPGDPRAACANPPAQLFVQSMLNLCHQIQSSLPPAATSPAAEAKPRAVGPRSPPDPYHSPLPKKSVADSTNGGYPAAGAANSRFEERSREISPKPLSLDERLELELGVKRTTATAKKAPGPLPPAALRPAPMAMAPRGFYAMPPMYENGVPNFSTPPPPLHFGPRMSGAPAVGPERNYYAAARPPINWNPANPVGPPPFLAANMAKIQPPVMLPPPGMPPRTMPPLPSEPKVPYRVPDPAGSKVHSIQVGNVLQIVPTELQPSSVSSQGATKQPPLPPQAPATCAVGLPATTYSPATNSILPGAATFSSLLSSHLPISFAAAPAVSGSKAKTPNNSRPAEPQPSSEPRPANETKTKLREAHHPAATTPTVTPPPIGPSGSKISNLPLPPGTSEADLKKLVRLAREKRLLKLRTANDSPATPTSDDSSLVEDQENTDEPLAPISIKPSPEQGILISPGFKEKSTPVTALGRSIIGSSRKMVSFVDGVRPGAPTVSDSPPTKARKPSPPPKKKHKVRVKIIRPEDSSDDDDSPPPPPPGPPPPELYPPTGIAALGLLPPGFILPKI